MENNIRDLSLKIRSLLQDAPEVVEYNRLAEAIKKNPSIQQQEESLKKMQQDMVNLLDSNKLDEYNLLVAQYKISKENYDKNPLIVNYMIAKEDLNNLILEIQNIIKQY